MRTTTRRLRTSLLLGLLAAAAAVAVAPPAAGAADTPKEEQPKIYDESADGAQQIAAALATARAEDKRVLLDFGANWCGWCRSLHRLFTTDPKISERVANDYVLVMIDVNAGRNKDVDLKYGHPTRYGIPAIVILDARGKRLKTKNTADLENAKEGHNPRKVLAFLEKWSPRR